MKTHGFTKLFKKYPLSASATGLALAFALAWYLRSSAVTENEQLRARRIAEKTRLESNIRNAIQLQEQFDALVGANSMVASRLLKAGDLAANQQYFYELEANAGVKITDLKTQAATPSAKGAVVQKGAYSPVSYSCTIQGGYVQVLTFLRKLERGRHYNRIVSGSIVAVSAEDNLDPQLTLTLAVDLLGFP
jgi:hypothetical protein